MATIASPASPALLAPGRLSGFAGKLRCALASHRRYVATMRALQALSDRQLDDIGIRRIDIERIARRPAIG